MEAEPKKSSWNAAAWVLLVVAVGLAAGAGLALAIHVPMNPPPSGPPGPPPPPASATQLNVVLSTLSVVLVGALLIVYGRIYRSTRAPYVLGLLVFLGALLAGVVLNSPLLFAAFQLGPGNLGRFLAWSDLLMSVGLAIFLYLSLQ
jgi:hypothetical protein